MINAFNVRANDKVMILDLLVNGLILYAFMRLSIFMYYLSIKDPLSNIPPRFIARMSINHNQSKLCILEVKLVNHKILISIVKALNQNSQQKIIFILC